MLILLFTAQISANKEETLLPKDGSSVFARFDRFNNRMISEVSVYFIENQIVVFEANFALDAML